MPKIHFFGQKRHFLGLGKRPKKTIYIEDIENSEYECTSTEDLQAKVEEVNDKLYKEAFDEEEENIKPPLVAGSLDFKAMYPSFQPKESAEIVRKRLEHGPTKIEVNEEELSRFLKIVLTDEEIADDKIEELIHSVKDGESKPKITDPEMTGSDQFRHGSRSRLNPPTRKPTDQEKKKLTAIAMAWLVRHIMTNFIYTFGGVDRRQEGGGPMGSDFTQALSRLIGNEFDELFLEKSTEDWDDS